MIHTVLLVVPRPSFPAVLLRWGLPPLPTAAIIVALALYLRGIRRVRELQPRHPWPHGRTAAFLSGLAILFVAVASPIEAFDTTLFSVHMVQHLLLVSIAAPLLMNGAPITLAIRASSPPFRRKVLLPVLRSRPVRVITHPVVSFLAFAIVLWGTHFTSIFNATLTNPWLHEAEHALYMFTACLFWWQAFGVDPSPWKLSYPARALYVFMGMPQMTLLALALMVTNRVLYPAYSTVVRHWGPSVIDDQKLAAFVMWIPSELVYVVALLVVVSRWLSAEQRTSDLAEARLHS